MTSVTTTAAKGTPRIFELRPDNWPAAFILAIVISILTVVGGLVAGFVAVDGVKAGERVVVRGAPLVRLASLSTQVPAHGHVH